MKNDAFMEQDLNFEKYVVTGHWPVDNYAHKVPSFNPIVNDTKRIISIDGGNVIRDGGQLNAFIISNSEFTYDSVDDLPTLSVEKAQTERGGSLHITWLDRFVELVEDGDPFATYRHLSSGKLISLPKSTLWADGDGNLCGCRFATDYYLPVNAGDTVSVIGRFGNKIYAKKDGTAGWIDV